MTAALPADGIIARAFGGAVIASATAPGPASYDDYGQRFVFVPAVGDMDHYALDVECRSTPVPPQLERSLRPYFSRLGVPFFDGWTRLEVSAKLSGRPVLERVNEIKGTCLFSDDENTVILRVDTSTHWIAVGRRRHFG
ncbi:hypothetical protein KDD17_13945 [Sulfitobacter albidus]|uniref:Uncharacterized protein n=1 Tax=Sulfitobacter albidus TaxID=2829501 RepID=A0A975JD17_9RHOB|nr:hypothetical protein [Sulfitobacter albidus]QUJ76016.1 hypothetical protein KDD17_13945 [Sulfitobacter albidus]